MRAKRRRRLLLTLSILLSGSAVPALAGTRQAATVLLPENPEAREKQLSDGYADAVVTGDTIYLSGVVAGLRDQDDTLEAAYTRAFERIGAILRRGGSGWDDVVDMTSYHTDLTTQFPALILVKNRYVKAPPPAWTAIEISRLIPDRGVTEIKIVAKLQTGKR